RIVWLLEWLRAEANMLADVFARPTGEPGDLSPRLAPRLIETPHQRRNPGEPALQHHDLQLRELLKHPVADEADQAALKVVDEAASQLHVRRGPSAGPRRAHQSGRGPDVKGNSKVVARGGFPDRVEVLVTPGHERRS